MYGWGVLILGLFFWGNVIFKMCYFFARKQSRSSRNFLFDSVPWHQLCWQTHNYHSEKEDNMNETEAFITQLCGRPGRCDFHCRGDLFMPHPDLPCINNCRSHLFPTPQQHDAYRHVSIHHDNGNHIARAFHKVA